MGNWSFLGYQSFEIWIMVIGAIACSACGLIGAHLVLRKLSLMGDAISHSVLPGIAVGAMISGKIASLPVLIGAGTVGVATPYLIDTLRASKRIYEDAAIGVIFTVLFSIGVILVVHMGNVHLDVDCVLYGEIATAPFDVWRVGGTNLGPRSIWILGPILILDLLFVIVLYKELKICAFDEGLAHSMGMRPRLVHYLLLGLVALTTIAAFESVGAIIVVAMLIAPGATAYLLTDRLGVMLVLSTAFGGASAVLGYILTLYLGGKVSIAGCMATVAGLLFALAFLLSPRYGVVPRALRRLGLARRLRDDHVLADLYRAHEAGSEAVEERAFLAGEFAHDRPTPTTVRRLIRRGLLERTAGRLRLTDAGQKEGERLVRAHRLWEAYLQDKLGLPADHVHPGADAMEHFLDPELQKKLAAALENPERDPHGQPIP